MARVQTALLICTALLGVRPGGAEVPAAAVPDPRLRVAPYRADEVYHLRGYAGYQIDLEFEAGETFVGLGAGDLQSLAFSVQDNHLFLKPRAANVDTNLTILTNRRSYHFDYIAGERRPDLQAADVMYALRFVYSDATATRSVDLAAQRLAAAPATRWHNLDYGYRGSPSLKPESAWDDGVQTHLRFAARRELPAVFVRNEDGTESLVNFNMESDEFVVQRVAREFVVRRGRLYGCIVNRGFSGAGERLSSGTIAPDVERVTQGVQP
ncbi:MAG TPA: TrbG/VirB9 family P-type conjugative transfer protein [Steroidobacteraceae bacterium]|nr:TrbG/VirB9 family P-type conjugative transfer protein [Steroidobacteraceae bacterium]